MAPAWRRSLHGVPLVIAGQSDKVEVGAGTVTVDSACRAHARRLQAELQWHSPFDEIAQAVTEVWRKHRPC